MRRRVEPTAQRSAQTGAALLGKPCRHLERVGWANLETLWKRKEPGTNSIQQLQCNTATVCELFVVNLVVLLFCFIQMSG